jgi:hypothetical protein
MVANNGITINSMGIYKLIGKMYGKRLKEIDIEGTCMSKNVKRLQQYQW